jgi:hypothetical protein
LKFPKNLDLLQPTTRRFLQADLVVAVDKNRFERAEDHLSNATVEAIEMRSRVEAVSVLKAAF